MKFEYKLSKLTKILLREYLKSDPMGIHSEIFYFDLLPKELKWKLIALGYTDNLKGTVEAFLSNEAIKRNKKARQEL